MSLALAGTLRSGVPRLRGTMSAAPPLAVTPRYKLSLSDVSSLAQDLDRLVGGAWAPRRAGIIAASRTFAFYGGYCLVSSLPTAIQDGTIVCPDNARSYIQRTTAGVVSASTTYDGAKIPMAVVDCAGGVLQHYEDIRDLGLT